MTRACFSTFAVAVQSNARPIGIQGKDNVVCDAVLLAEPILRTVKCPARSFYRIADSMYHLSPPIGESDDVSRQHYRLR